MSAQAATTAPINRTVCGLSILFPWKVPTLTPTIVYYTSSYLGLKVSSKLGNGVSNYILPPKHTMVKLLTIVCFTGLASVAAYILFRERQDRLAGIVPTLSQYQPETRSDSYGGEYAYPNSQIPPPNKLLPRSTYDVERGSIASNWLPAQGIDRQYQNKSILGNPDFADRHPVLAYQAYHNKAINPANIGDPIRIPDVAGPINNNSNFYDALMIRPEAIPYNPRPEAVQHEGFGLWPPQAVYRPPGPYPGENMNVPVPMGSLKFYSERYNPDQFKLPNPNLYPTLGGSPSMVPPVGGGWGSGPGIYQGPPPLIPSQVLPTGSPLPYQNRPVDSNDFFRPYGPNGVINTTPFFGSVNAYSPFPEINTPWEKAGILTSTNVSVSPGNRILNLFRRPIAPLQDLWEYQVQDKDGFVIRLDNKYIEDGDIITHIIGKEGMGPYRASIFVQNKYIWV